MTRAWDVGIGTEASHLLWLRLTMRAYCGRDLAAPYANVHLRASSTFPHLPLRQLSSIPAFSLLCSTHLLNVGALLDDQVVVLEADLAVAGSTSVRVRDRTKRGVEACGVRLDSRGKTVRGIRGSGSHRSSARSVRIARECRRCRNGVRERNGSSGRGVNRRTERSTSASAGVSMRMARRWSRQVEGVGKGWYQTSRAFVIGFGTR